MAECTKFDIKCGLYKFWCKSFPHFKIVENRINLSYPRSYPHYPHGWNVNNSIYIKCFGTNVLVKNHKITKFDKKY